MNVKSYICRPGDFTGPMNYIRALLRYDSMTTAIQGVPILLIWGTGDGALSKDMVELSREYSNNFRARYIEGASHWVQQEEADIVNGYMKDFLSGIEQ